MRGGFSDRNGIKSENTQIQYKEFDDHTRICLINLVNIIFNAIYQYRNDSEQSKQIFLKKILSQVYMEVVDFSEYVRKRRVFELIEDTILCDEYDSILTLIEFICQNFNDASHKDWSTEFNNIFRQEYVGYRFIGQRIVPITDENEIKSIEDAMETKQDSISEHLKKAVGLLSDRQSPDYENSIKESISAVEAMCVSILGKGATLGVALKLLEKDGVVIHPSLKSAFEKLYGYTSDAKGIRYAGNIGGASSTFEEAKFMLVSCSAFINYLTGVLAN